MDCFSPFVLRKASWQSKLITLTCEESRSACNSSTLDLFSLSFLQIWSKPLCKHTRNKQELLHNRSRVKTSGPCYVTCYFQHCWQMTVNTWLEKINATDLFSSITLHRNNLFFETFCKRQVWIIPIWKCQKCIFRKHGQFWGTMIP